ncbi:unnamed protein product [Ceratitis capitata]|uniref:(Mediterranean fruit fly) hypothetical protein n=1 Tax=Ceratitis capitata TaxID=7213 RepID=A0A811VJQ8_CERCA|nr:unnamed protein product [Ceratitis capitata]
MSTVLDNIVDLVIIIELVEFTYDGIWSYCQSAFLTLEEPFTELTLLIINNSQDKSIAVR